MDLQQIIQLDEQYYTRNFGARMPVAFDHGSGCTLYDTQGRAYTDFFAGIAVNALGYGYPSFMQGMHAQLDKLTHTSSVYYIENQARLAQALAQNSFADRVFIANTGSEANEGALKMARKYFYAQGIDRYEIISLNNSFHGRTLAMVKATGQEKYQKPYHPLPPEIINVAPGDLAALEAAITGHTAGIMLEVVQGEGGVRVFDEQYVKGVQALCNRHGILMIIDEVQTGIGRTGKLFGYEHYDVTPDIVTVAKALGNGIPVGAILAREPFASAFEPGDHGTTFGGNPFSCMAGLLVMQALTQEGVLDAVPGKAAYLREKLEGLLAKHNVIKEIRGLGLLIGIEMDASTPVGGIVSRMLERGFVVGSAGGNTLRLAPPLIIENTDIDAMIEALDDTLTEGLAWT